jgi:hypothetical protein
VIGPEASQGEWAAGIALAFVFFLVYGVTYWLVADHIWPRIVCSFTKHEWWADGRGCSRCGKQAIR